MNYNEGGLSASDVALLTGARNNNGGNDGFGDGAGAWWIIIFLIFAFLGWGNGGFGGNGGNAGTQGALTRGDLCMDMNFNDLQGGVRNINDAVNLGFSNLNSTICHQQYDTATLINGVNQNIAGTTAALQSTLCQGFNGINTNMMNGNFNLQTAVNGIGSQLAQCCCDVRQEIANTSCTTQRGLDGINYNMAMNTNTLQNTMNTNANGLQNTMCNNTRDIIQSQENRN